MKKLAVILMVSAVILSLSFASGASETNSKINVISREEGSGTRGAFVELTGVEEKKVSITGF